MSNEFGDIPGTPIEVEIEDIVGVHPELEDFLVDGSIDLESIENVISAWGGGTYKYLDESAAQFLSQTNEIRIKSIQPQYWIEYPCIAEIISNLNALLEYPRKKHMPNILIDGDANTGKTMLIERFHKLNPGYELEDNEGVVIPALFMSALEVPNEEGFYNELLKRMFANCYLAESASEKKRRLLVLLNSCNVQMLVIDDIQFVEKEGLEQGSELLDAIQSLGSELMIPIVGIRTTDALRPKNSESSFDSRFIQITLPKLEYGDDYCRLLTKFERMMPLKRPSNLCGKQLSMKLFEMSGG